MQIGTICQTTDVPLQGDTGAQPLQFRSSAGPGHRCCDPGAVDLCQGMRIALTSRARSHDANPEGVAGISHFRQMLAPPRHHSYRETPKTGRRKCVLNIAEEKDGDSITHAGRRQAIRCGQAVR